MKKIIFLSLFISFSIVLFGKNYINYNIYLFRYSIYEDINIDSANFYLLKAYNEIPDKTKFPALYKIIKYGISTNNEKIIKDAIYNLSYTYSKKDILSNLQFYKVDSIIYKYQINLLDNPKAHYLKNNNEYDSTINYMIEIDQLAKNNSVKYGVPGDSLDNYCGVIDSLNFVTIKYLFKKYGFI